MDFEKPFSFFMGPESLLQLSTCRDLGDLLSKVISLDDDTVRRRLQLVKVGRLDHTLILCSPSFDGVFLLKADIDGIQSLLARVHPGAAERFSRVSNQFRRLVGQLKTDFQHRIDVFSNHWDSWRKLDSCMWIQRGGSDCGSDKFVSFDSYCEEFDECISELETIDEDTPDIVRFGTGPILCTRRMMYTLIGCNKYFGYDGFTYDDHGRSVGEEFLTINAPLPEQSDMTESGCSWVYLSSFDKFKP